MPRNQSSEAISPEEYNKLREEVTILRKMIETTIDLAVRIDSSVTEVIPVENQ
jgi:hypothetical protein